MWRESANPDAPLVVLLHGIGSHEGDLFGLVPELPEDVAVASLRAPLPWPNGGHAWFELGTTPVGGFTYDADQVQAAGQAVIDWLNYHAAQYRKVALVGFSQGAATALQVATLSPDRITCLAMLSGLLPFEDPATARGPRQLPALIAIGDFDEVIGDRAMALETWAEENLDATISHYPIGHWVSAEELADLRRFLGLHLNEQPA